MSVYNVGPDHAPRGDVKVECIECRTVDRPVWDGANGIWICYHCYEDLSAVYEGPADEDGGY